MRCLERNMRRFWYAGYESTINDDGEPYNAYREPTEAYACISAATGYVGMEMFGTTEGYQKIIVIDDTDFPIDENTVFWIDKEPGYDGDNPTGFDYVVARLSKHLDSIGVAVKKVDVE